MFHVWYVCFGIMLRCFVQQRYFRRERIVCRTPWEGGPLCSSEGKRGVFPLQLWLCHVYAVSPKLTNWSGFLWLWSPGGKYCCCFATMTLHLLWISSCCFGICPESLMESWMGNKLTSWKICSGGLKQLQINFAVEQTTFLVSYWEWPSVVPKLRTWFVLYRSESLQLSRKKLKMPGAYWETYQLHNLLGPGTALHRHY